MTGWKHSTTAHKQIIMEYLTDKHGIPAPAQNDPEAFSGKFSNYWIADTVANALASHLEARASYDGANQAVPADWDDNDSYRHASVAFNIGVIAKQKKAQPFDKVIDAYAAAVAGSSAPDFFDALPDFQQRDFRTEDGGSITGAAILKEASKLRFPSGPPSWIRSPEPDQ